MPVRAVNLKLVVPRRPAQLGPAQALWTTHRLVNEATSYYEHLFLMCRQRDYQTREALVPVADQEVELNAIIGAARVRNATVFQ